MDKVISRTISEIDKVKNENLELNDKLNIARTENERLREENEKLKWLLETKCQSEWEKENAELKAENERLKNSLKICQGLCKTLEKAKANEHNHWFNRCCEINTECDKYRQALQEIREDIKNCNNGKCFSCKYNSNDLDNCRDKMDDLIIDKINEVIGVE